MGKSGHQRSVARPLSQSSTSISRRPFVPKGKAAASIPKSNRFRTAARSVRLANLAPMVAVDDERQSDAAMEGGGGAEDLMRHLSIMNASGADMAGSSRESIVSIRESVLTRATEKELGITATAEFRFHVAAVLKMILAEHEQLAGGSYSRDSIVPSNLDHYFALLELLKGDTGAAGKPEAQAAIAYLLHMCARKLPKRELAPLVDESCEAITPLLGELTGNSESTAAGTALRFLVSTLGCLLSAHREEGDAGKSQQNLHEEVFTQLVKLSLDDARLAVRATARKTLRTLLTDPLRCGDDGWHPASPSVAAYLHTRIRSPPVSGGANERGTRLFCLLEGIMHRMSGGDFRQLVEALLVFCSSSRDVAGVCAALKSLREVLTHQPMELSLNPDANVELIHALRSLPPTTDHSVLAYWIRALVEAHVCLASDAVRSADSLEETTKLLGRLFAKLGGGKEMGEYLFTASQRLIQCCLRPSGWSSTGYAARDFLRHLDEALSVRNMPGWEWVLRTMCSLLEECQEEMRGEEAKKVLQTMATIRDRSEEEGEECGHRRRQLDQLFATAIRHLGLEYVLGVVSLLEDLDPDVPVMSTEFKRSWLLPVAAQSVRNCSLAYFNRYLLPLASRLHSRFPPQSQPLPANAALQAKLYAAVEAQLWSLLPRMVATRPIDFPTSFPPLCPILGAALNERADLRLTLLATLRAALRHVANSDEPSDEECDVMERYAKNFLPILFSLYSGQRVEANATSTSAPARVSDKSVRLAALETVRLYVPRVPQPLLATYINLAVEKVADESLPIDRRSAIMDILVALVKGVSSADVLEESVVPSVKGWLLDGGAGTTSTARRNSPMQKKAYRLLSEIYQRVNDPALQSFFASNSPLIDSLIDGGTEGVAPNARPWRVALYRSLITSHAASYDKLKALCASILNEVTECLDRENNKASRTQAAKCMCEICAVLVSKAEENGELAYIALDPVVSQLVARLPQRKATNAKSARKQLKVARSRLVALNIIAQKHLRQMNASLLSRLLAYAVDAIAHSEPSVRMLAVRLLRVASVKMQNFSLVQYKDMLLTAALQQRIDKDTPVKMRKANALLFEALLERFGVESMLPLAEHNPLLVKQLKNLEKGMRRRERRNKATVGTGEHDRDSLMEEGGGSENLVGTSYHASTQLTSGARTAHVDSIFELLEDSDEDDGDGDEEHGNDRKGRRSVIVGERAGEDPVNLLDRDAMLGRVSSSNAPSRPLGAKRPTGGSKEKPQQADFFPVDSRNGKLVVVDLERQERKLEKKRRRANQLDQESGDEGEEEEVERNSSKTNKKRRRRLEEMLDDEDQ